MFKKRCSRVPSLSVSPQDGGGGLGPQPGGRTGRFSGGAEEVDRRSRGEERDRAEEKGSSDGAERMGGAEREGGGDHGGTSQRCQRVSKNESVYLSVFLAHKCLQPKYEPRKYLCASVYYLFIHLYVGRS